MKIRKKVLLELRRNLPKGSGVVIQERLAARGIEYSLSYIYRVLDPESEPYNEAIVDEATSYLEELQIIRLQKEQRIMSAAS